MKSLHRPDLFAWSTFDEPRNLDFNSLLWVRPGGNVAVDPLPMSAHDATHLDVLGGLAWIVVTTSDHVRDAKALAARTGARIAGPASEREAFPVACHRWLADGDEVVPGLTALALDGSKTPGELALRLEPATLITGDLVRAPRLGELTMLPEAMLKDRAAAVRSIRRLAGLDEIRHVLVGDGWPIAVRGGEALRALADRLNDPDS